MYSFEYKYTIKHNYEQKMNKLKIMQIIFENRIIFLIFVFFCKLCKQMFAISEHLCYAISVNTCRPAFRLQKASFYVTAGVHS